MRPPQLAGEKKEEEKDDVEIRREREREGMEMLERENQILHLETEKPSTLTLTRLLRAHSTTYAPLTSISGGSSLTLVIAFTW